jgi:hypothetical protein
MNILQASYGQFEELNSPLIKGNACKNKQFLSWLPTYGLEDETPVTTF